VNCETNCEQSHKLINPTYDTKLLLKASTKQAARLCKREASRFVGIRLNRPIGTRTGCQVDCQKDRGCMMGKTREKDDLMREWEGHCN